MDFVRNYALAEQIGEGLTLNELVCGKQVLLPIEF